MIKAGGQFTTLKEFGNSIMQHCTKICKYCECNHTNGLCAEISLSICEAIFTKSSPTLQPKCTSNLMYKQKPYYNNLDWPNAIIQLIKLTKLGKH